jgi:hypothetical protein
VLQTGLSENTRDLTRDSHVRGWTQLLPPRTLGTLGLMAVCHSVAMLGGVGQAVCPLTAMSTQRSADMRLVLEDLNTEVSVLSPGGGTRSPSHVRSWL